MDKIDARSSSSYLMHPFSGYLILLFLFALDDHFVTCILLKEFYV